MERRVWASSSVCVMADPPKALKVVRPHLAPHFFHLAAGKTATPN